MKVAEARKLAEALQTILDLHRPSFPPARPPIAPAPPTVDAAPILAHHRQAALAGLGLFDRQGRARAKVAAERVANAEVQQIHTNNVRMHQDYQRHLDHAWSRLLANDAEVVLGILGEAFEDNEAVAAPIGVDAAEAWVAVLVPASSAVPERHPTTTVAGNLSLKKLNKGELSSFYRQMVFGYVLVTVKEAFAVAPSLRHVRVIALRSGGLDAYGRPKVEAVAAARFARGALDAVLWDRADAATIVRDASTELTVRMKGPSKELVALDQGVEPGVAALLAAVDASELI